MPPVQPADFTDDMRAFFSRWTGGVFRDADKNPPLLTYARHPVLADVFSQFNIHLLSTSTLPVRERQIAILRVAWLCRSNYVWSSHLNTSQRCGLAADVFAPVQRGADDPFFTAFEQTVVRATDDLVLEHVVSQPNWDALAAVWDDKQLLDFLFTVGAYVMTAGVMRSLAVARPPHLVELGLQYGVPE